MRPSEWMRRQPYVWMRDDVVYGAILIPEERVTVLGKKFQEYKFERDYDSAQYVAMKESQVAIAKACLMERENGHLKSGFMYWWYPVAWLIEGGV